MVLKVAEMGLEGSMNTQIRVQFGKSLWPQQKEKMGIDYTMYE